MACYNEHRPHRALGRRTPREAFEAKVKAHPASPGSDSHLRVRRDRVDKSGCVTLRYQSRLLHIGLGRAHAGRRIVVFVADLDVRVVTEDGELIRHLTLDPSRDYQRRGRG